MNYITRLYDSTMTILAISTSDNYNEAVFWGKSALDSHYGNVHGFIVFNKDNKIEYFESL